jgi:hypothetical protein
MGCRVILVFSKVFFDLFQSLPVNFLCLVLCVRILYGSLNHQIIPLLLEEILYIREHAEEIVLVEEFEDQVTIAKRIVEKVPEGVLQSYQGLLCILRH